MVRTITSAEAFAERMRAARRSAGLSQADLAKRLAQLGFARLKRTTILAIEKKTRNVSLDEALAIAAALGVAPIHLMVPFEDERIISEDAADDGIFEASTRLKVGELEFLPKEARRWIRGTQLPGYQLDRWPTYYVTETPPAYRWRLRREAAHVRNRSAKTGRWPQKQPEPLDEEKMPTISVPPGPAQDESQKLPADLWTYINFGSVAGD